MIVIYIFLCVIIFLFSLIVLALFMIHKSMTDIKCQIASSLEKIEIQLAYSNCQIDDELKIIPFDRRSWTPTLDWRQLQKKD